MSALQGLLDGLDDFPTLPDVALRVCDALRDPEVDLARIAREVSLDPAMSGQLVRLANSAIFGGDPRVDTVQRALTRLGIRAARNALMTVTLMRAVPPLPPPFTIRSFWVQGLASAVLSWRIAQDVHYRDPEQAYLAGLVHDIGTAYLAVQHVDRVQAAIEHWQDTGEDFVERLGKEFDCPVAHVSAAVLRHWNFSEEIATAVEQHRDPQPATPEGLLPAIILAADRLTRELGLAVVEPHVAERSWIRDVPAFLERRLVEGGAPGLSGYLDQLRADVEMIESFARSVFPGG